MKFAVLGYEDTKNIGDSVQTVALLQHIDQDYIIVNRDCLNEYNGEPCTVVMNGWFSHKPKNWPPSPKITPIFFGFHMTPEAAAEYAHHVDYFKKYEPIGCRDAGTAEYLKSWGVEAYVSGCATMTFTARTETPENGKIIIVDVNHRKFNREERKDFVRVTQESHVDFSSDHIRNQVAYDLLQFYKNNAKGIITSRIHCAMPSFAMGIPVIYCGIQEYRTKIISDIGIKPFEFARFGRLKMKDFNFNIPDFQQRKVAIAEKLRSLLADHDIKLKSWQP